MAEWAGGRTAASVHTGPIRMYVCLCYGVTDRDIQQAAEAGCRTTAELTMRTGAGANCGSCLSMAAELIGEVHARRELPMLMQDAA